MAHCRKMESFLIFLLVTTPVLWSTVLAYEGQVQGHDPPSSKEKDELERDEHLTRLINLPAETEAGVAESPSPRFETQDATVATSLANDDDTAFPEDETSLAGGKIDEWIVLIPRSSSLHPLTDVNNTAIPKSPSAEGIIPAHTPESTCRGGSDLATAGLIDTPSYDQSPSAVASPLAQSSETHLISAMDPSTASCTPSPLFSSSVSQPVIAVESIVEPSAIATVSEPSATIISIYSPLAEAPTIHSSYSSSSSSSSPAPPTVSLSDTPSSMDLSSPPSPSTYHSTILSPTLPNITSPSESHSPSPSLAEPSRPFVDLIDQSHPPTPTMPLPLASEELATHVPLSPSPPPPETKTTSPKRIVPLDKWKEEVLQQMHDVTRTPSNHAPPPVASTTSDTGTGQEGNVQVHFQFPIEGSMSRARFNYASFDAGAKVLAANPEAQGVSAILVDDKDKYMLNKCGARLQWVIVELSEEILLDTFVVANYEYYSSMYKDFQLLGSTSYPTSQWMLLGDFIALNVRTEQHFILQQPTWVRYIRFRLLTHYGKEFYCTLSQVRVHGSTMIEDFKNEMERSTEEILQMQLRLISGGNNPSSSSLSSERRYSSPSTQREPEAKSIPAMEEPTQPSLTKTGGEGSKEGQGLSEWVTFVKGFRRMLGTTNRAASSSSNDQQKEDVVLPSPSLPASSSSSSSLAASPSSAATPSSPVLSSITAATMASSLSASSAVQRTVTEASSPSASLNISSIAQGTQPQHQPQETLLSSSPSATSSSSATTPTSSAAPFSSSSSGGLPPLEEAPIPPLPSASSTNETIAIQTGAAPTPSVGAAPVQQPVVDGGPPSSSSTPQRESYSFPSQQESIFRTLSNKIKSLEINQSLLNHYLGELNDRYMDAFGDLQLQLYELRDMQAANAALVLNSTTLLTAVHRQLKESAGGMARINSFVNLAHSELRHDITRVEGIVMERQLWHWVELAIVATSSVLASMVCASLIGRSSRSPYRDGPSSSSTIEERRRPKRRRVNQQPLGSNGPTPLPRTTTRRPGSPSNLSPPHDGSQAREVPIPLLVVPLSPPQPYPPALKRRASSELLKPKPEVVRSRSAAPLLVLVPTAGTEVTSPGLSSSEEALKRTSTDLLLSSVVSRRRSVTEDDDHRKLVRGSNSRRSSGDVLILDNDETKSLGGETRRRSVDGVGFTEIHKNHFRRKSIIVENIEADAVVVLNRPELQRRKSAEEPVVVVGVEESLVVGDSRRRSADLTDDGHVAPRDRRKLTDLSDANSIQVIESSSSRRKSAGGGSSSTSVQNTLTVELRSAPASPEISSSSMSSLMKSDPGGGRKTAPGASSKARPRMSPTVPPLPSPPNVGGSRGGRGGSKPFATQSTGSKSRGGS